jgi:spore coat protein SA
MKVLLVVPEGDRLNRQGSGPLHTIVETYQRAGIENVEAVSRRSKNVNVPYPVHYVPFWNGIDAALQRFPKRVRKRLNRPGYSILASARTRNGDYDLIHIVNRPQYVARFRKKNPEAKILLHMLNDHLLRVPEETAVLAIQQSDLVACNSQYTANRLTDRFPESKGKTDVIHRGIDTQRFHPPNGASPKRNGNTVLYAGRLVPEKGVHHLIEAMHTIADSHDDARLLIAGGHRAGATNTTNYIRKLEDMAEGSPCQVRFLGNASWHEMPKIYHRADVLASPSVWNEPFGLMNLEAMACGLPVVTSPRGGIPEAVGDTGILVDPEDPQSIAKGILRVLESPELAHRLGQQGRKRVVTLFDRDKKSHEFKGLITRLAGRHRQGDNGARTGVAE